MYDNRERIAIIVPDKPLCAMRIEKRPDYLTPSVEWITLEPLAGVLNNSIDPSFEDDEEEWED